MNTANLNVCKIADDIIEIFENQGFTSDTPPDIETLRHLITEAIQKLDNNSDNLKIPVTIEQANELADLTSPFGKYGAFNNGGRE